MTSAKKRAEDAMPSRTSKNPIAKSRPNLLSPAYGVEAVGALFVIVMDAGESTTPAVEAAVNSA